MSRAWHLAAGPRSPWKVRYFLDTEFTDFQGFQLISLGIVGEDGREFYGERSDFETSLCSDFVQNSVLPHLGSLPDRSLPTGQLRQELLEWMAAAPLKPKPVLCYDFEGDLTLVERLLGGPLPRGWRFEDVEHRIDARRRMDYLDGHGVAHHALHDARANAVAFR